MSDIREERDRYKLVLQQYANRENWRYRNKGSLIANIWEPAYDGWRWADKVLRDYEKTNRSTDSVG